MWGEVGRPVGPRALRGDRWGQSLETTFFGRYEHTLDVKGRVVLPSRFRPAFQTEGGYLTPYLEGCLALWTREEFERQSDLRRREAAAGRAARNALRVWSSGCHFVEVDGQGRVAVPQRLREFAALDGDVLVTGAIDRVEIWNVDNWNVLIRPEEERLRTGEMAGVPGSTDAPPSTEPPLVTET